MVRRSLAAAGVAVALTGAVLLDTSPVIERLHRQEKAEERQDAGDV